MHNLKLLFKKAKIKYIVSVDDCYDTSITPDKFQAIQACLDNQKLFKTFCIEISREDVLDVLANLDEEYNDYIEGVINDLSEEHMDLLYKRVIPYINIEQSGLESFCEELKSHKIIEQFVKLPSTKDAFDFYSNIEPVFPSVGEDKVLWLVDNDFSKTGGSSEDGKILIEALIQKSNYGHIFALSSAQTNLTDSNDIFRNSLSNNNHNEPLLACLIKKHNIISKQYSDLYDDMYLGFRENYSGEIIKKFRDVTEHAATESCDTISSLSDETINKVIFLGSKIDGISPIETFQRLMMIVLKFDISKNIGQNYDELSKLIYNYSELCSWCDINKTTGEDFTVVESLRKKEYYDENINKTYTSIGYGDIFKINSKYYLLIAQSCNVSIRDSGERKANCATLVEIKSNANSSLSTIPLEYFKSQINSCVSFNDTINVDFSVLDLCTINSDGSLFLPEGFNIDIVKFRYTNGALLSLTNVIQHNLILKSKYKELIQKKNEMSIIEIIKSTREIYKDNTLELLVDFENGIRYNGYRVCRLNKDIMDNISKRYSEYHSRKALDFDFAANYKPMTFDLIYNFDLSLIGINKERFNFIPKYTYYKTDHFDKPQSFKKDIEKQFATYYKNLIKLDQNIISGHKSNLENMSIEIPNNFIPVVFGDTTYIDILDYKDSKIHIKLAKKIIADKLVNKSNGTHICNTSNSSMIISQHFVTFIFEQGQPFEYKNLEYVKNELTFTLSHNEKTLVLSL